MFAAGIAWGCGDFLCQQTEFYFQSNVGKFVESDCDWKRVQLAAIYGAFIMTPLATLWYEGSLKGGLIFLRELKYFKPRLREWKKIKPWRLSMLQSGLTFVCLAPILATSNISFHEYFYHGNDFATIVENVRKKIIPVLTVDFCYWPLVDFANFYFIPTIFRVPFLLLADVIWSFLLSAINHNVGSEKVVYEFKTQTSKHIQELTAISKHFKCFCEEDDSISPELFPNVASTNPVIDEILHMFGSNDAKIHALVFNAIDTEKKSYLELQELQNVFHILNSDDFENDEIEKLFQLFDLNGDGKICFEEFCTFMKQMDCLEPEQARALFSNFIFVGFDIEKNKQIEKREVEIIFDVLGFKEDVDDFMGKFEPSEEGLISKNEFKEFMSKNVSFLHGEG